MFVSLFTLSMEKSSRVILVRLVKPTDMLYKCSFVFISTLNTEKWLYYQKLKPQPSKNLFWRVWRLFLSLSSVLLFVHRPVLTLLDVLIIEAYMLFRRSLAVSNLLQILKFVIIVRWLQSHPHRLWHRPGGTSCLFPTSKTCRVQMHAIDWMGESHSNGHLKHHWCLL